MRLGTGGPRCIALRELRDAPFASTAASDFQHFKGHFVQEFPGVAFER